MVIKEVTDNKWDHAELLLLADEQKDMIEKYLERGTMFILDDRGVKAECVVTDEGGGILEIKNIATVPKYAGKGYGKSLIRFIENKYGGQYHTLKAGTGDSPLTVPFYKKCGFTESYRVKDFFIKNYDHPIIECGVRLTDMVYFVKSLTPHKP